MKKLLLLFATIQLSVVANAYDFTDNGIFFDLKSDGSLEVTGLASWTTRADILSDVTINGTTYQVTSIGAHAFEGRSDITYLSIPWSVTSIGEYAFIDCGSNLTVNIADPESWCQMQLGNEHSSPLSSAGKVLVHDIETTNIVIPEGVTSIGNFTFYQCRCIRSLTIPSSVNSIGSSAFEDCTGLTTLALSEGLQSIGGSAFQGCADLKTLTIPSTVKTISINAFANCSNITDVYCYAENVPDTHFDAFEDTPTEKSTLYVPTNAVKAYKTSWPWSDFKNVLAFGSDPYDNPKKRTIHVTTAGSLRNIISESEKSVITELTLTGVLNGYDLGFLCEMAGKSCYWGYSGRQLYNNSALGSLSVLDLSGVRIVAGGNYYEDMWDTSKSDWEIRSLKNDNELPYSVFFGCNQLTSVTIPNSVTAIGLRAFSNCSSLTSIKVESGNTKYDSRNDCNAIIETTSNTLIVGCKNTVIPNNVTTIGSSAFSYCSGLTSVAIPNSVTSIGSSAFEHCSGLTSVTIPNSVTSIGSSAFYGCSGLTSVTIGNSVTSIDYETFRDCSGLTSVTIGNSVKSIDFRAFSCCSGLTSITIPNSVTSIGSSAFESCKGLTSVTIPNSVTSIGSSAFVGCSGLTSVTISNSVKSIDSQTFYNCSGLTSVIIPNSVKSIGNYAFAYCSGLTSVTIPNSVTSIGSSAFAYCSGLTSIKVESSNTKYDSRNDCNAIIKTSSNTLIVGCKNTIIPNNVSSIGDNAFSGCSGLTSVTIPNSVTSIGYDAFFYCTGLTSIIIPNSVTSIYSTAFDGTAWYNNQPDGLVYAGKVAYKYKGEMPVNTHIVIEDGTLVINNSLFSGHSDLNSVTIPNSVTSIGDGAFYNCSGLISVTIPNSVTSIGSYVFQGCSSLTTIMSEIENPFEIDSQVFYSNEKDLYSIATLIVPKGKKAAYQATGGWNKFANIFEVGDVNGDNKINNDDLNAIVSYIMGKTPDNFNAKVADLNNDGKVNVADVTILVKIIKNIQ